MITIKVLRSKKVKLIIVPKYKELGVNKIWALIKVVDELNAYFLDYRDNEPPERKFIGELYHLSVPKKQPNSYLMQE